MQAARGTSLSDATPDQAPSPSPTRLRVLFALVALGCLAVDQISKALAVAHLTPGEPRRVLGPALRLDLTRNPGAAFSTGTAHTEWFAALAIVAAIVVAAVAFRAGTRLWAVALGVLMAGIVGNLVDRIVRAPGGFRGHVVDFLEFPHWPIFNMADVCITIAAVLIVLQALRGVPLGGRPTPVPSASSGQSGSPESPDSPGADG